MSTPPLPPTPSNPSTPDTRASTPPARSPSLKSSIREKLPLADRIFLAIENPVLRRELLTALRSNKAFVLHFFYLLVLGGVIFNLWPIEAISTGDILTRKLFSVFGISQLVLLAMLSPAFSASAMTIEKESRCIDMLMTSPIPPGTILMGKYLSSVVYLFLLVLSTAPLVSIILWLPGLGPADVAGLYLLLLSVACSFGMIGLTCSVFFHRSQASLSLTYMIVLPLVLILLLCAVSFDGFFLLQSALWPSGFLLVASVIMYRACYARLRRPFDPVHKSADDEDVSSQTGLVLVRDRFPDNMLAPARTDELMPDGVNPIYQKEIQNEVFGRGTLFLRLIIQISMFLSVIFLTFLYMGREHIFVDFLVIFTMLVAPAFACNTFTQERERGTLELLLTTLIRPSQIISGKFLSCLRLSIFLTGLVGVTMCFYLFVGQGTLVDRIVAFLVYLGIILITIIFETALAMFYSLTFRSTVHSMITTYATLLILFGTPVAARELILAFNTKIQRTELAYFLFVSPFETIYTVTAKSLGQSGGIESQSILWPYYFAIYAALSIVLIAFVYVTFERRALDGARAR